MFQELSIFSITYSTFSPPSGPPQASHPPAECWQWPHCPLPSVWPQNTLPGGAGGYGGPLPTDPFGGQGTPLGGVGAVPVLPPGVRAVVGGGDSLALHQGGANDSPHEDSFLRP